MQNTNVYSMPKSPEEILKREAQKHRITTILANLSLLNNKIPELNWEDLDENLDIGQYLVVSNTFTQSVEALKNFIIEYKCEREQKIELFKEKIDKNIKKFNIIIANIRGNCDNNVCINQCKVYKPNDIYLISTYDLISQIVLFDLQNNITNLENQLNYLQLNINKTKNFINFNRTNIFLKQSNNEFNLIAVNSFKHFFKIKEKIWKNVYILMENVANFGKLLDDIGDSIALELKQQLISFACCSKMFELNLTTFVCNDTEYYLKQFENSKFIKYEKLMETSSEEEEEEENF